MTTDAGTVFPKTHLKFQKGKRKRRGERGGDKKTKQKNKPTYREFIYKSGTHSVFTLQSSSSHATSNMYDLI